jgi:hypothetical protein
MSSSTRLRTLRSRIVARRHTALLVAIVASIAVRPMIGNAGIGPGLFSIAMLMLMLVALYTVQVDELAGEREVLLAQRRRRTIVGWTLAVLAIAERLATLFAPSPELYLIGSVSWMLFFGFVTWVELRGVLKQKEITGETISMAVSVYLLFAVTCGLLYTIIFERHPEAFSFGSSPAPTMADQNVFAVFTYFSLTTLSTIGFGDITPLTLQARFAAVAEGIAGQFYLAILVARLVGMQMTRSADR